MSAVNSVGAIPVVIGTTGFLLISEKLAPVKKRKQFSRPVQTDVSNFIV